MAAKNLIVAVVLALLVLSTGRAVAQDYYDKKKLLGLFKAALRNNSDALWTLQETFFNPGSKQSPDQVCLSVSISVQDIADPEPQSGYYEFSKMGPAFVYDNGMWYFNSYYQLFQQVNDDASDTRKLANLLTKSGSTGMFYSFDPSFYSIMQKKGCSRKMCTHMICVTLNGLIICGLLLAITLLFMVLVDNGLKSAGMGGLILSLVPPLAVFIIGLIINQKYFKSQKEPPTTVTAMCALEPEEPNQIQWMIMKGTRRVHHYYSKGGLAPS